MMNDLETECLIRSMERVVREPRDEGRRETLVIEGARTAWRGLELAEVRVRLRGKGRCSFEHDGCNTFRIGLCAMKPALGGINGGRSTCGRRF